MAIGQERSRVTFPVPAVLFGFTLEPIWRDGGAELMTTTTELTTRVRLSHTCGQHLLSCDQHQTGLAWEVVQPGKGHEYSQNQLHKGNKIKNSPKTPAQQFYELTIKEALFFK